MSQPGVIDGLQFARDSGELRGRLELGQMPRLADSNVSTGEIDFTLTGGYAQGKSNLNILASGRLGLTCQRCLEPLAFEVRVEVALELCADEALIASAEDEIDRVLASSAMSVAGLVEDEVLLVLPAAPKHELCELRVEGGQGRPDSPFGALRALGDLGKGVG